MYLQSTTYSAWIKGMLGRKHDGCFEFPFVQSVCVCVVCMCLSLCVPDVAVLNAEHHIGAGAAAGALLEQTAALQR